MKSYFASLFVVAFLQVAMAQIVDINIVNGEFSAQIAARQRQLGITIGANNMLFGQTNGVIGNILATGNSNITDLQNQLNSLRDAAIAEAQAANKNIDVCVQALDASVLALNPTEIQGCGTLPQLGLARFKLNQLSWFQRDLGNAVPNCVALNASDVVQVRVCVNGELDRIDNGVNAAVAESTRLLNEAKAVSEECVNVIRTNLESQAATIENDLRTCVAAN